MRLSLRVSWIGGHLLESDVKDRARKRRFLDQANIGICGIASSKNLYRYSHKPTSNVVRQAERDGISAELADGLPFLNEPKKFPYRSVQY